MAVSDPSEREGGGTWGSRETSADWQRGVAARLQMFGSATEQLLDQANIRAGSRVLDIGAGAGDQTLGTARLAVRRRHEAGRRPRTLLVVAAVTQRDDPGGIRPWEGGQLERWGEANAVGSPRAACDERRLRAPPLWNRAEGESPARGQATGPAMVSLTRHCRPSSRRRTRRSKPSNPR